MTRLLLPLAVFGAVSGCIIYEERLVYEDEEGLEGSPGTGGERPDHQDPTDTDTQPEETDPSLVCQPSGAAVGDTIIISILVNVDVDVDIDLLDVTSVTFYGPSDIDVLVTQIRNDEEVLVTIDIPDDAAPGSNDLLVEMGDGNAVYIEDAFEVVTDPADAPGDNYAGSACP